MAGTYDDQQGDKSNSPDPDERHYGNEFNTTGGAHANDAPDRDDLKNAEEDAGSESTGDDSSPANAVSDNEKQGDAGAPKPERGGIFKRARNSVKGRSNKAKKRVAIITAVLLSAVTPLLILLAFLLLALKVPHFVANVAAWQFAKVTRIQASSVENVLSEEAAMKTADNAWYSKLRERYSGMRDNTFRNLERISPAIVVRNLSVAGKLKYVETPRSGALGKLGFTQIKAITINDRSVLVPKSMFSFTDKYIHPIQTVKDRFAFYGAVDDALRTYNPNVNMLVRSKAALNLLTDRLGSVGFKGILMQNFFGKSKVDAATELQAEAYAAAEAKASSPSSAPDEVKKATQQAADDTDKCVQDRTCLRGTTGSSDGVVSTAENSVDKAFTTTAVSGFIKGAIGVINPLYAVAVPVCLVYSGSVFNPEASNAQSDAVQREATQVLAADSQIKRGDINSIQVINGTLSTDKPTSTDASYNANGDGVGALGQKLDGVDGNGIINSNALLRSGGQNPNTLQVGTGTQQTALGGFGATTIFDVLLPHSISGPLNTAADDLCPAATNIWAGAALGVANIAVLAVSAMGSAGAGAAAEYGTEAGAEVAAQTGMEVFVDNIIATFTTKAGAVQAFSKTGRFGYQFTKRVGRDVTLILGATYLAKLMTFYNSGMLHNGLQSGTTYANDIDNGANQLGNTMCQGVYYGRFLTYTETTQNEQDDRSVTSQYAAQQNSYQRYLALSNPDSMLTKFGEATVVKVNRNSIASAISNLGNIFNPMSFMPKMFSSLTGKAAAAANVKTANYGNMQCGYTRDEYSLIKNTAKNGDGSYSSASENAYRLDNAGKETFDAIDKEYGPCFTAKIGDLMTKKDDDDNLYLVRTDDGDLSSKSVCSPENLGPNNSKYGDLVFRYRLEHMYDTSVQNLYNVQKAGEAELGTKPTAAI